MPERKFFSIHIDLNPSDTFWALFGWALFSVGAGTFIYLFGKVISKGQI